MKKSSLGIVALSLLFAFPVFAQDAAAPVAEPTMEQFPVLQKIKDEAKGALSFDYVGRESDADVWLVSGDKVMQMVHVLPSGSAIVGGVLVSSEGKELSTGLQKKFADAHRERAAEILANVRKSMGADAATVAPLSAEEVKTKAAATSNLIWSRMPTLGLIRYGADKDAPILYLVMDPTEAPSQEAFKKVEQFAIDKKLDLRVVPISLTSAESVMPIATAMGASDPATALKEVMDGKKPAADEPPNPQGVAALKNNADFSQALHLDKVPAVFYRKSEKDPIRVIKGAPKDWSSVFKELGLE